MASDAPNEKRIATTIGMTHAARLHRLRGKSNTTSAATIDAATASQPHEEAGERSGRRDAVLLAIRDPRRPQPFGCRLRCLRIRRQPGDEAAEAAAREVHDLRMRS